MPKAELKYGARSIGTHIFFGRELVMTAGEEASRASPEEATSAGALREDVVVAFLRLSTLPSPCRRPPNTQRSTKSLDWRRPRKRRPDSHHVCSSPCRPRLRHNTAVGSVRNSRLCVQQSRSSPDKLQAQGEARRRCEKLVDALLSIRSTSTTDGSF